MSTGHNDSESKSYDSVQYVGTVLASDRHYCRGYDDGVVEPRLACQLGCCPASLGQSFNQGYGNRIAYA